ncbi:MAG TPA: HAD family hydrolase [Chthonomonadaceae bacterium]|nr:HAD family hydrolase [Chthonomonadaceae bacterium]
MIQAVLFDLDNTLYDRDLTFERCSHAFVEEHFAEIGHDQRAEVLEQMRTRGFEGHQARVALFADLLARFPHLPHNDAVSFEEVFFRQWLGYMTLDEGTQTLLNWLDEAAMPFGIITNGSVIQHRKIERLGLRSRVKCIFVSAEFGHKKPYSGIFRAAAACLDIPCEHILFVGDHPELDIFGANRVGMTTAWLHRGLPWPDTITSVQPDYVIASLGELLPLLRA